MVQEVYDFLLGVRSQVVRLHLQQLYFLGLFVADLFSYLFVAKMQDSENIYERRKLRIKPNIFSC